MRDCRRVFCARVRVSSRDTGTGMIACLTLKPSERTHRDASHARASMIADGGRPTLPHRTAQKTTRQINRLIISLSFNLYKLSVPD